MQFAERNNNAGAGEKYSRPNGQQKYGDSYMKNVCEISFNKGFSFLWSKEANVDFIGWLLSWCALKN